MSSDRLYFYPLWLRIWHGINAFGIILLIITGVMMHWALHGTIVNFYTVVKVHNITGVIIALNYIFFLVWNLLSGNTRFYNLKRKSWIKRLVTQANYYMVGMFKDQASPYPLNEKRKFNPLQKFAYFNIMYIILPMVILSGIALLYPDIILEKVYSISGVFLTSILHASLGFLVSIFLIVHVYAASIGKSPLQNFKSMVNGWHVVNH